MDIEAVRAIALALPEVIEAPDFGDGAFRVQGRIFVCVSPDQRPVHIMLHEQERLLALEVYGKAMAPALGHAHPGPARGPVARGPTSRCAPGAGGMAPQGVTTAGRRYHGPGTGGLISGGVVRQPI